MTLRIKDQTGLGNLLRILVLDEYRLQLWRADAAEWDKYSRSPAQLFGPSI